MSDREMIDALGAMTERCYKAEEERDEVRADNKILRQVAARIGRERDEARAGIDFEEIEKAVQVLWKSIRSLHSVVLRADGDLSGLRGRLQKPWFELAEKARSERDALQRELEVTQEELKKAHKDTLQRERGREGSS